MSLDMYSERVAEASALIREFAKIEYYHYFQGDTERALEAFIAMLDQAEEKGRRAAQPVALSDEQVKKIAGCLRGASTMNWITEETAQELSAILAAKEQANGN
jgi:anti-sigma factor ChrR (cupin superfamily)